LFTPGGFKSNLQPQSPNADQFKAIATQNLRSCHFWALQMYFKENLKDDWFDAKNWHANIWQMPNIGQCLVGYHVYSPTSQEVANF
jgi:hypothetical protein